MCTPYHGGMNTLNHRHIDIDLRAIDPEARTVVATLSTENPVTRWGGVEILEHSPQAVDLTRATPNLPLLFAHDQTDPVGVVENVRLVGRALKGVLRFSTNPKAEQVFNDVKAGILRCLSIGYRTIDESEIPDGVKITRWELYEASVVTIPADTGAVIGRNFSGEKTRMSDTQETQDTQEPQMDARSIKFERDRIAQIRKAVQIAKLGDDFANDLIERGLSVPDAKELIMRKWSDRVDATAPRGGHDSYTNRHDDFHAAVVDHFMIRAGIRVKNPHPATGDFKRLSVLGLAETCLSRAGVPYLTLSRDQLIKRAMTTSDFPLILGNIGAKSLELSYNEAPISFGWTKEREVNNFLPQTLAKLSEAPDLEEVPERGEYTHGYLSEYAESVAVKTFGKIISLTRQAMINDNLGAFTNLATAFSASARRLEADLVYTRLTSNPTMSDGKTLFHADHGNLMTGALLSTTSLALARTALRKQKGIGGSYIDLIPTYLIVPPEIESLALQLVASEVDPGATGAPNTSNLAWVRALQVAVDPRLSDSNPKGWYLACSPSQTETVTRAYIAGEARPYSEERIGFETDSIDLKCRIDAAAVVADWRGLVYNPGPA
jgi:HK97 family phage prohead protease